jgi:hypothetical protein
MKERSQGAGIKKASTKEAQIESAWIKGLV